MVGRWPSRPFQDFGVARTLIDLGSNQLATYPPVRVQPEGLEIVSKM